MAAGFVDLYAILGVARSATMAELRHAYRRLALAHHPDRAGPHSAARFAEIADAYRLLSDPLARATYDETLAARGAWGRRQPGGAVHAGGVDWTVGTNGWRVSRPRPVSDLLARISGKLDDLIARGVARRRADGDIDLMLSADEARAGGNAAIATSIEVACSSCGGVASPGGVWCRICEYKGHVAEEVTVVVAIEPATRPGARVAVAVGGRRPPLRFHLDVPSDPP